MSARASGTSSGVGGTPPDQEDPRADLLWGTVPRLVEDAAVRHASREALVEGDVRLTFAELASEVDRYARGFIAAGVDAGDRVAMWAPNCAEWMLAALGALRVGAVLVPLNTRFKGAEAAYILRSSGATLLVTVRGFLGVDYPALPPTPPPTPLPSTRSSASLTSWLRELRSTQQRRPAEPTPSDPTTPRT
jgi:acyl-CoA synthetase (AMP-forming)/AMP-acid ligase II